MSFVHPDPAEKMNAIRDGLCWAADVPVVWIDQTDGGRVREANEVWGELRPRQITKRGQDERRDTDLEDVTPALPAPLEQPRQSCIAALRNLNMELVLKSRSQEHRASAWFAGTRAQIKIGSEYMREKYLKPVGLSFVNARDVINMPSMTIHDDRIEDVALIEFDMETFFIDEDATMFGTWIEQVEVSSTLKHSASVPLDASIQLDKELMP